MLRWPYPADSSPASVAAAANLVFSKGNSPSWVMISLLSLERRPRRDGPRFNKPQHLRLPRASGGGLLRPVGAHVGVSWAGFGVSWAGFDAWPAATGRATGRPIYSSVFTSA